jgi:SAM-dependent methyltransferase
VETPAYIELLRSPVSGAVLRWCPSDSSLSAESGERFGSSGTTLLLHPDLPAAEPRPLPGALHRWMVDRCYAGHNRSASIKAALSRVLAPLDSGGWGLNIGGGFSRLHERLITLDLEPRDEVDISADAHRLPFGEGSLDVIVSQEVFEHLANPAAALREVARVLKSGGHVYLQVPFIIGYHPGPTDYWRFTREGICALATTAGLEVVEREVAVGTGTGMYRVAVEFIAAFGGLFPGRRPYLAVKGAAALLLYPLTWLDPLLDRSSARDRIPGGYYVIAQKP